METIIRGRGVKASMMLTNIVTFIHIPLILIALFLVPKAAISYPMNGGDSLKKGRHLLEEIEPIFLKTPIYLNADENFINTAKSKLLQALDYLEKANEQVSNDRDILFLLGKAYSFAHDMDVSGAWFKSVEYLQKSLKIDSKNSMARIFLGKNYMDAKRFDDAFLEYSEANRLSPNGFALRNMALVRIFQKRNDEANVLLDAYIKYNPNDSEAIKIMDALKSGGVDYGELSHETGVEIGDGSIFPLKRDETSIKERSGGVTLCEGCEKPAVGATLTE
jgi:tetratricopeptide (TPR) repeat protein